MSQNVDPKEIRENLVRDAKRNLILDAARQVFAVKGFHDTKLEEIATACGFSKASLYNYYEDKESLFLHLAIREHERMSEKFKERLKMSASFEQNLREILELVMARLGEQFGFLITVSNFQSMAHLCTAPEGSKGQRAELVKMFHESIHESVRITEQIIASAQKKGEIRADIPAAKLTGYIGSLLRGVIFQWRISGKMDTVENEVGQMVQFILKGFGK